jgi:hypothetical protein
VLVVAGGDGGVEDVGGDGEPLEPVPVDVLVPVDVPVLVDVLPPVDPALPVDAVLPVDAPPPLAEAASVGELTAP